MRKNKRRQSQASNAKCATAVRSLSEIPEDVTPDKVYRIEVEVLRIVERDTKTDDVCYFLSCRDEDNVRFSIVVWEVQMDEMRESVEEGKVVIVDVKVPKPGYSAFTLA
jgi:DNA polymerase III alpha subunit